MFALSLVVGFLILLLFVVGAGMLGSSALGIASLALTLALVLAIAGRFRCGEEEAARAASAVSPPALPVA